jgi:ferric-dicitrate binding protein FerR (iron transport regulator)
MNAGPSSDFPHGTGVDPRHEAVWRLLERAPLPQPDGWFTARTLARCRTDRRETVSLARVWRWALGGGLGICLAVGLMVAQVGQRPPVQTQEAEQQKNVQEAFEIMASTDNSDTDSSASSPTWQDSSL